MEETEFINWQPVGKGQIKLGKEMGRGAESRVYEGSFGDRRVAVKEMFDGKENEVNVLPNLEHKNIIKYIHTERDVTRIYIVLELCSFNLKQFVEKRYKDVTLSRVEVLRQIVDGVDYLHNGQSFCTIHRDLKPSNILFSYSKRASEWAVKISDFGISKDIDACKTSTRSYPRGTSGYMAPELLDLEDGSKAKRRVGKETDIFPLGVIFYYTLSGGKHPFSEDQYAVDKKIRDDEPNLSELGEEYKIDVEPLISLMIQRDWRERPTAAEIKSHYMFWNAQKKLLFIQVVSDSLEDRKSHQQLINKLEKKCKELTDGNWRDKISGPENPEVKKALERRATNNPQSLKKPSPKKQKLAVQDLLRQIRNMAHHYADPGTSEELRRELGSLPDGLMQFFESKFPMLLSHTYDIMKEKKQVFKEFYGIRSETTPFQGGASSSVPGEAIRPEYTEDSDEELLCLDQETQSGPDAERQNDKVLKLRDYQLELAEQALAGHNSVIIAPTGSGKTAVANEIIRNHLQQQKAKSILFFVSKTTLAVQQHHFFSRYLGDLLKETEVAYLIGEIAASAPPVGSIMKEMKLTVLTPQILIDELKRSKSFLKFDDISMMIFDECHNAHKKHPYKVIMDMLLDFQNETLEPLAIQIIGMTASPGVGKAKHREQVMENLIILLANLNVIQCPAVVRKNKDELKKYQNDIEENYIRVTVDDDIFSKKILKAIQLIEGRIDSLGILGSNAIQVSYPPMDKTKQVYEHWVVQLINHVRLNIHDKEPSKQSLARKVVTYGEHLQMYYTLLYLKKHIPNAMDVTDSLASFDQNCDEGRFLRKINQELHRSSKDAAVPMLDKLIQELKKQFEQNRESRCIIFVPRKLIASELVKCIQTHSNLAYLKPEYLTGTNDQESVGGMTKNKQQSALEAFRAGRCKVLIATSVAEEGLDIRACNLVIMYNYVTNEVGRIQRAGRGRAENSKSILIAPCGSAQIERERMNEICASATACAIDDLNELSANERVGRVRKVQQKQAKERKLDRYGKDLRLQEASKWQILCGKCQAVITTADHLRQIKNQHKFVIDPTFKSRVFKRHFNSEQREVAPGVIGIGEFRCGNQECKHYLGLEMQYKKKLYPTLTVKQLIFEGKNGGRRTAKQWNKCPFEILKDMEDSDDESQKIDKDAIHEFASGQSKSLGKGFEAEDLSKEDAMETLYLDNNF